VLCSLGIGGPPTVSYAGALLLLLALPVPHLLRTRRLRPHRDAVVAADTAATSVGLAGPAAVFWALQTDSDLLLGVVVACLAAALTVSAAARHELGPVLRPPSTRPGSEPAQPGAGWQEGHQ
jgi:hypothetical protein